LVFKQGYLLADEIKLSCQRRPKTSLLAGFFQLIKDIDVEILKAYIFEASDGG